MTNKHLYHINSYVEDIREYKVASHEIWTVSADKQGNYLKLDWNEATIPPSPKVKETIQRLVDDGNFYNLYPMTQNERLMLALSRYVRLPQDYIQYFASSDSLQEYLCRTFLDFHSRVLILSPTYDNFRLTAESCGAEIIYSDMRKNFIFDSVLFEDDIWNYNPELVYICNPNNPTGYQHSENYIRHLLEAFPRTMFLVDVAYWVVSGVTVKDFTQNHRNLLICRTFSKAFGLANFRIGYLISNPYNIALVNKIRNPKNITTFAQEAAVAALSDLNYMWEYVRKVTESRNYFLKELSFFENIGIPYDSQGNFVMFQFHNEETKAEVVDVLRKAHIYVRETTQRPSVLKCIRISIGTKDQMRKVINILRDFLQRQH